MDKISITLLFLLVTCFFANGQDDFPGFIEKMALTEQKNFRFKSTFHENTNYNLFDLTYQRMEWEIDPAVRFISGEITSYFKSKTDSLTEIKFDLINALAIDSILQKNAHIEFVHTENQVIIQLEKTLENEQIDSVTIFYSGVPGNTGYGSFTQSEHEGIPIIWTLSEPYGAMDWWPCKQSLSDKIDSIDIIVKTPELYRTASNGILVSEKTDKNFREMHWKHRYPIATYLVAIAVTNYADYSEFLELDDNNRIEILNFVYPEDLGSSKIYSSVTTQIMELYNEKIGIYPFADEKYGHAQFGWGGGMEHQTMSFVGSFNFNLIAHEMAHQWFGDYITLGSWHDIWLNEGFATYLTGLTYENLKSKTDWYKWRKNSISYIVGLPGGSVFVSDTTDVSRIFSGRLSYTKGAYLLHMLRWVLGDDAFFQGIRNYFNDPEIANGFANNQQFISHLESVGDTSLTEFFNDWYYGEGFPIYSVNYIQENEESLEIQLTQTQSHNSVDFFEMPVPIRLYNSERTDSVDFKLNHIHNNQKFKVSPGFIVGEMVIDPECWLISKTAEIVSTPVFTISNEVQIYPNPFSNQIKITLPVHWRSNQIDLFSIEGKLLMHLNPKSNEYDLSNLTNGIYLLLINTSEGTVQEKLVKY